MLAEFFNKRPVLPLLEGNLSRTRQVFLKNPDLTPGKIMVVIVQISLVIQAKGTGIEIRGAHRCPESVYNHPCSIKRSSTASELDAGLMVQTILVLWAGNFMAASVFE